MRRVGGFLAIGLLATGACSGDEPNPAPTDLSAPDSASAASSPGSPSTSGSGTGQSSAAAECLRHRYQLLRFVAIAGEQAYGTGEGGDVYVTFTNPPGNDSSVADQTYLLEGRGKDPIRLTLAGTTAEVAAIVAPKGSAAVACTDNALTLTAQSVRFEFARV